MVSWVCVSRCGGCRGAGAGLSPALRGLGRHRCAWSVWRLLVGLAVWRGLVGALVGEGWSPDSGAGEW